MPTYDYVCPTCKTRFELFTRIDDTETKPCPTCGKKKAQRQIGAGAGFIFKGSGFYVTDSKAPKADAKPETKPTEPPKKKKAE